MNVPCHIGNLHSPAATIGTNVSTFWDDILPVGTLVRAASAPAAQAVISVLLDAEQRISSLTIDALETIRDRCAELLEVE